MDRLGDVARRRAPALLLMGALLLSAACGGKSSPSQPAAQTGSPAPAGAAAGAPTGSAAAVAVTATSSAAGGSGVAAAGAGQASGATIDLCSLLTVEEAKAALGGREMAPPQRGQYVSSGSCHYRPQSAPLEVVVWLDTAASPAAARREFEAEQRTDDGQAVAGLGEAAYVTKKLRNKIVVLTGARRLNILILPPSRATEEEVRATLITLGTAAAARIR